MITFKPVIVFKSKNAICIEFDNNISVLTAVVKPMAG